MKTNRKWIATVMGLFLLSSTSYADGNKLLERCLLTERFLDNQEVPDNPFDAGVCTGFLLGVRDTMYVMSYNRSIKACIPDGVSNGQAVRIVTSYLKKNPALLHEHEASLTMKAYTDAYPCK